jgi:uncharacterized BrkB/YihY/UPF0761 family membrane protein
MNILRSFGAIIAGILVIVVLSVGTDAILEKTGVYPSRQVVYSTWMLAVALVYRSIYAIVGGYFTALLAPDKPLKHAIMLGGIGTVISILGVIAGWDLSAHWYPVGLVITALPCSWLGGKLRAG